MNTRTKRTPSSTRRARYLLIGIALFVCANVVRAQTVNAVLDWGTDTKRFILDKGDYFTDYSMAADRSLRGLRPIEEWPAVAPYKGQIVSGITWNNGKVYLFLTGGTYVRLDTATGQIDQGARNVAGNWRGINPRYVPLLTAVAWITGDQVDFFWNDNSYTRFSVSKDEALDYDSYKNFAGNFSGLRSYGSMITAAVKWNNGKMYFFLNNGNYVRYDLSPNVDRVDQDPQSTWQYWPGLFGRGDPWIIVQQKKDVRHLWWIGGTLYETVDSYNDQGQVVFPATDMYPENAPGAPPRMAPTIPGSTPRKSPNTIQVDSGLIGSPVMVTRPGSSNALILYNKSGRLTALSYREGQRIQGPPSNLDLGISPFAAVRLPHAGSPDQLNLLVLRLDLPGIAATTVAITGTNTLRVTTGRTSRLSMPSSSTLLGFSNLQAAAYATKQQGSNTTVHRLVLGLEKSDVQFAGRPQVFVGSGNLSQDGGVGNLTWTHRGSTTAANSVALTVDIAGQVHMTFRTEGNGTTETGRTEHWVLDSANGQWTRSVLDTDISRFGVPPAYAHEVGREEKLSPGANGGSRLPLNRVAFTPDGTRAHQERIAYVREHILPSKPAGYKQVIGIIHGGPPMPRGNVLLTEGEAMGTFTIRNTKSSSNKISTSMSKSTYVEGSAGGGAGDALLTDSKAVVGVEASGEWGTVNEDEMETTLDLGTEIIQSTPTTLRKNKRDLQRVGAVVVMDSNVNGVAYYLEGPDGRRLSDSPFMILAYRSQPTMRKIPFPIKELVDRAVAERQGGQLFRGVSVTQFMSYAYPQRRKMLESLRDSQKARQLRASWDITGGMSESVVEGTQMESMTGSVTDYSAGAYAATEGKVAGAAWEGEVHSGERGHSEITTTVGLGSTREMESRIENLKGDIEVSWVVTSDGVPGLEQFEGITQEEYEQYRDHPGFTAEPALTNYAFSAYMLSPDQDYMRQFEEYMNTFPEGQEWWARERPDPGSCPWVVTYTVDITATGEDLESESVSLSTSGVAGQSIFSPKQLKLFPQLQSLIQRFAPRHDARFDGWLKLLRR